MSKFISTNELDSFGFHDACFKCISLQGKDLLWQLSHASVSAKNSQNSYHKYMETGIIDLIFNECIIEQISYFGQKSYDKEGNLLSEKPGRIYAISEYPGIFNTLVKYSGVISKLGPSDDYSKRCRFDILTPFDGISIMLEYSSVVAKWDEFKK